MRPSRVAHASRVLLALGLLPLVGCETPHDLVITDVRYLAGERITSEAHVVAIRGDRISYVGKRRPEATQSLDGHGRVLAPGFLDTNIPGFIPAGPPSERKLLDGVTTYLSAHGGLAGDNLAVHGIPAVLNYATTVGLAGFRDRLTDPKFDVLGALQAALVAGAYGISLAPEYDPEHTTPELVRAICERFGSEAVPISFHARYSSREQELDGVEEAVECARHGSPVHLLHLSSTGATHHPREAVAIIERARTSGLTVFFDFYPYTMWASSIQRTRFRGDWLARYGIGWDRVRRPGRAEALDAESFEALRQTGEDWIIAVDAIPQATVDYFALETTASIGTDSTPSPARVLHPRGVGSFAKFIRDYVQSGKMPLDQALYRLSTQSYERFAPYIPDLRQRGRIEVGYAADLVLWDPEAVRDNATLERPLEPSTGVVAALVNGTLVLVDGRATSAARDTGRWMRGRWQHGP